MAILAAAQCGAKGSAAIPRRPITPEHPLFLFQTGAPEAFAALPPRVRACSAMFLGAIGVRGATERLERWLDAAAKAGVPAAIAIRTHFPVRDERDYGVRMMTPEDLERILERHENVIAVLDSEQYSFNAEQRRYLVRTLGIAARHGVHFIFNAGWHAGCNWDDVVFDEDVRRAIARYGEYFIPMWEMNISKGMYTQHAQLLGLWLGGWCRHWGANPQRWYWGEAGFGALGESFGCRFACHGGMACAGEYLRYFPLYGPMLGLTVLTGAEVLFIGGERYPTLFTATGKLSTYATQTILPFLEALLEQRLIPARETVAGAVRLAVRNPTGTPFVRDDGTARTGRWSLRLDCGGGASRSLAWGTDGFIRITSRGEHILRVWVKTRDMETVRLQLSWFDGTSWKEVRSQALSGDRDWTPLEIRSRPPAGAEHALIFFKAESAAGTAWFDDASFQELATGRERLANGSFEEGRAGGNRAVGWQPQCVTAPPETHLCHRGPNALWQAAYGVRHDAESIPNSGTYFPIAWLPAHLPEGVAASRPGPIVTIDPDWRPEDLRRLLPAAAGDRRGFAFAVGGSFFLANSHENEDRDETAGCVCRGISLEAELPVHAWVAGGVRAGRLFLLAGGRETREILVRVRPACRVSSPPVPGVAVTVAGEETTVRFAHDRRGSLAVMLELPPRF